MIYSMVVVFYSEDTLTTYTHARKHTHTHTHTRTHIHAHARTQARTHTCTDHTHTVTHTNLINTHWRTQYSHTHTHTRTHARTHARTHTHKFKAHRQCFIFVLSAFVNAYVLGSALYICKIYSFCIYYDDYTLLFVIQMIETGNKLLSKCN